MRWSHRETRLIHRLNSPSHTYILWELTPRLRLSHQKRRSLTRIVLEKISWPKQFCSITIYLIINVCQRERKNHHCENTSSHASTTGCHNGLIQSDTCKRKSDKSKIKIGQIYSCLWKHLKALHKLKENEHLKGTRQNLVCICFSDE